MKKVVLLILVHISVNVFAQSEQTFEALLESNFPKNSSIDGRWVYYSEQANIEKINKVEINARHPSIVIYKVILTNFLGHHINRGACLVLHDTAEQKLALVEPIWYGGISKSLFELCIGEKFPDGESLIEFLEEIHQLMTLSSTFEFKLIEKTEKSLSFALFTKKGSSQTTGNDEVNSTVNYRKKDIWREIKVSIRRSKIVKYTSINPITKEKVVIK